MNDYQYRTIYGILHNLVQQMQHRIGPQVAQRIIDDFHPQQGRHQASLVQAVERYWPAHVWQGAHGPSADAVAQVLTPQILEWAASIHQAQQQQQARYQQAPMSGAYYGGQTLTPTAMGGGGYDHGLGGTPVAPAPQAPPPPPAAPIAPTAPVNPMLSPEARSAFETVFGSHSTEPAQEPPMAAPALAQDVDLVDADEADILLPDGYGFRRIRHLQGQTEDGTAVTHIGYDALRPANDGFEIFRRLWPRLHTCLPLGQWSVTVHYDRLLYIPDMGVAQFRKIVDTVRERLDSHQDRLPILAAINGIGEFSRNEWKVFQTVIVREINRRMSQWGRSSKRPTNLTTIEGLEDVADLLRLLESREAGSNHKGALAAQIFDPIVTMLFRAPEGLIRQKYPRTGTDNPNIRTSIGVDDSARGDLMACEQIEIDLDAHPGLDKFNALLLPAEDRVKIFDELTRTSTVLRVPDALVIQNSITDASALQRCSLSAFGTAQQDQMLVAQEIANSSLIYGLPDGRPPAQALVQFTPVLTVENDFFLDPIRGHPGLQF